jgi:hypothetical protein
MDIKRVAFESKPINKTTGESVTTERSVDPVPVRKTPSRNEIAALVDGFLSKRVTEPIPVETPAIQSPSPVKTILHHLIPEAPPVAERPPVASDFVSEDDVRRAIADGKKIYISKKTILTPSARDLGEEKEIFSLL